MKTETFEQHLLKLIENKNALISYYESKLESFSKKQAGNKTKRSSVTSGKRIKKHPK